MALQEPTREELKEFIESMKDHKGRATELITVYIPAGYDVNAVQRQLEAEKSTAKNIKSTSTRKNVSDSLDRIVRVLKDYKVTPPRGMAIFAGDVSQVESQSDIQSWEISPPEDIKVRLYRCDKEFVLEPLESMTEVSEIYGLLVMDRKEATIGRLIGKSIEVLQKMTSGVPSKVRAGGQCISPDTLVMKDNGEIIEIKDSHNPLFVISQNFNSERTEKTPIIAKWENNKLLYKITTCYPKFEIKASKDHSFFVRTDKGIQEKSLSEIREGDYLLLPEKIEINNSDQLINFSPIIKQSFNTKKVHIPKKINPKLTRLFGYYLGDGSYEIDRLTFFEQREEVAKFYQKLIKELFEIEPKLSFRKSKNYWQLRIYSRILSQFFKSIFNSKNKTLNERISPMILTSSNNSLASFIGGFFDAEGYVSLGRIGAGFNNQILAKQIQFCLLRLGILSSLLEYDNKRNPYSKNIRYTITIDDIDSIKKFKNLIGFCSLEKQKKIEELIDKRSNRNKVRQLIVNGIEVARIIRNSGLNTRNFHCGYFFCNKRQMSKEVFKKKILDKIKDDELKKRLEMFYNSNLVAIKISKIELLGLSKTIDIETKNHNFIANGLIVHNSSQRFHRITEGLTKEFYKRIADEMKNLFYEEIKLKGILIGGPVPTKNEFVDGEYLPTRLRKKIIGVKDQGDTSQSGLQELVGLSQDVLANQEIIYEKKLLEKFFNSLGKDPKMTPYKYEDVKKALEFGAVDLLIISKNFERTKVNELKKIAGNMGTTIEIVSTETDEGDQFNKLSGIGAIQRFGI